jgi:hypothetical protein
MRATIQYTVIRLALFAVVCAFLVVLQVNVFLAAAIAAIVSLVISYFAFSKLRGRMAVELAARGGRNNRDEVVTKDSDTDAEDAALDEAEASSHGPKADDEGQR